MTDGNLLKRAEIAVADRYLPCPWARDGEHVDARDAAETGSGYAHELVRKKPSAEAETQVSRGDPGLVWRALLRCDLKVNRFLVIGIRNRLIHGYDAVDLDIVWQTVTEELPSLITILEAIVPQRDS